MYGQRSPKSLREGCFQPRQGWESAGMLLHFKKELIGEARKGDMSIINVHSNESWAELKILVTLGCFTDGTIAQVATNTLSPLRGRHLYDGS